MVLRKYLLKKVLTTAFFFLFFFYGIYVLIDYASHLSGAHYHHSNLHFKEFFIQYGAEFSLRANILIPFALLIGTVHTLSQMNSRSELVALMAGGYSLKTILRPFIYVAVAGTALLYINQEFLFPLSAKRVSHLNQKYSSKKLAAKKELRANKLPLEDGSILIYGNYIADTHELTDVYYLPDIDRVFVMKALEPFSSPPKGHFVDVFQRENGVLNYKTSFLHHTFDNLHLNKQMLSGVLQAPDELPIHELIASSSSPLTSEESEKAAKIETALYHKLALPWLALIAVLASAPLCLTFSRNVPVFLIFGMAIFILVALYLFFDAATVLGERQVIDPLWATIYPMALVFVFFSYRFARV